MLRLWLNFTFVCNTKFIDSGFGLLKNKKKNASGVYRIFSVFFLTKRIYLKKKKKKKRKSFGRRRYVTIRDRYKINYIEYLDGIKNWEEEKRIVRWFRVNFLSSVARYKKRKKEKKGTKRKNILNRYELLHIDFETLGDIFVHHQNIRVSDTYRDFERDY